MLGQKVWPGLCMERRDVASHSALGGSKLRTDARFQASRSRGWKCDDRLPARTVLMGLLFRLVHFGEAGDAQVIVTVQLRKIQFGREIGLAAMILSLASGVCFASPAAVSGIVRDSQGVAQMGAMVQVFAVGPVSVKTAFTDLYGRYKIANLVPGRYEIRATAALFVPATRANLLLSTGARATVNLTLTTLSDPAAWIPAERRKPDEPGDDWTWTLRSAANRPILRMMDDGQVVLVSSSVAEGSRAYVLGWLGKR